jgi:hypothetical protein
MTEVNWRQILDIAVVMTVMSELIEDVDQL